ncbi:putative ABC transporter ATP-binding protein YxlF [Ensifer sp. M14]|uniref:ABC transporter ATP-binding protein n=1 Tax=Ensifer sp. M14 TaxID=2203782 RepID=UPI000E1CA966|nr:ABC transporter ATP-binding protein [Ensifer sp. M14]RDL48431.1 putative ABC transporter ATP-binding protein YxlF [Ensifer sp. M14]
MTVTARVAEVTKKYNAVEAIRDVSFELVSGETVALVGHNGAGKTTLIKLLLGLIRPSSGDVAVLGQNPATGEWSVRQRLGYLPESVAFHLALTGRETLQFYARLKRVDPRKALALFERVGLASEAVDRPVRTYSKGMRQRLGLAQALLGEPGLLLLDEPTSGLDPALRRSFYDLVDDLRQTGCTVLLSSHALTELEHRTDRVIIVNKGRKVADGALEELRRVAKLPTRVGIQLTAGTRIAEWECNGTKWSSGRDSSSFETEIEPSKKIELLRHITTNPAQLQAITVTEPSLDDLYAHFLGRNAR